jgi:hypothetical protein
MNDEFRTGTLAFFLLFSIQHSSFIIGLCSADPVTDQQITDYSHDKNADHQADDGRRGLFVLDVERLDLSGGERQGCSATSKRAVVGRFMVIHIVELPFSQ